MKILYIGHSASRTGAPRVLLDLAGELAVRGFAGGEFLLPEEGPISAEYRKVAPVMASPWRPRPPVGVFLRVRNAVYRRLGLERGPEKVLGEMARGGRWDLIYSNTVANGREISALAGLGVPIVCHVHEMPFSIRNHYRDRFVPMIPHVGHFIAAGEDVRKGLCEEFGIPGERVSVLLEPVTGGHLEYVGGEGVSRWRERLRVGRDGILVGGAGTMDWRKGFDLFLQTALRTIRGGERRVRFVWAGGDLEGVEAAQARHDIACSGLEGWVQLVGSIPDTRDFQRALDVFVLSSREDPCPLVMLEAGAAGRPVIGFAGTGGVTGFAAEGAGILVGYMDVELMSRTIRELAKDPGRRRSLGEAARAKVSRDHDPRKLACELEVILRRVLGVERKNG